jgi:hypothetical protein
MRELTSGLAELVPPGVKCWSGRWDVVMPASSFTDAAMQLLRGCCSQLSIIWIRPIISPWTASVHRLERDGIRVKGTRKTHTIAGRIEDGRSDEYDQVRESRQRFVRALRVGFGP